MRWQGTWTVLTALTAALLAGCSGGGTRGSVSQPERALERYARALEQRDHDAAYAMMSTDFRKKYTRDDFVRLMREHGSQLSKSVAQLKGKPRRVNLRARVAYGQGEALELVLDNGVWRIASDPVDFYGQQTPDQALRSFIRAIERQRYDVVLRFVPNRWAESMTVDKLRQQWEGDKQQEVGTLLKNLKASLGSPIHRKGERATMPYGDRFEVRFLREDGVWKIEDPD